MATSKSNPRRANKRAPTTPARPRAPRKTPSPDGPNGEKSTDFEGLDENDELLGAATAAQLAEERRLGRKIPRVKALTTEDLGSLTPPVRQRYPVRMGQKIRELFRARELVLTFVERDLRVRYKQAV